LKILEAAKSQLRSLGHYEREEH